MLRYLIDRVFWSTSVHNNVSIEDQQATNMQSWIPVTAANHNDGSSLITGKNNPLARNNYKYILIINPTVLESIDCWIELFVSKQMFLIEGDLNIFQTSFLKKILKFFNSST